MRPSHAGAWWVWARFVASFPRVVLFLIYMTRRYTLLSQTVNVTHWRQTDVRTTFVVDLTSSTVGSQFGTAH